MSLRVWLPLNGTLDNQGLDNVVVTNNGATVDNSGKIGKCYSFDGSNDYVSFSYSFPSEDWSYSIWFYTTSTNTQTLGCCRNGVGFGFSVFLISNKVRIDGIIGNDNQQWTTTYTYPTNTWINLIVTSKNGLIKYYINGEYQASKNVTVNNTKLGNIFTIGASQTDGSGLGNYFKGKINDVRIYNHALSPMEVKQISQGLILHYPLNNNGWGQENLLINSNVERTSKNSYPFWPFASEDIPKISGNVCTISFDAKSTVDNVACDVYFRSTTMVGQSIIVSNITTEYKRYNVTMTAPTSAFVSICIRNNHNVPGASTTATYSYKNIKVELGQKATPWCPHEADELYDKLGLNDNVEYDTSGFCNNGTRTGTFSWISDTPKYNVGTKFLANIIKNTIFNFTSNIWTVAFWYYYDTAPSAYQGFLCLSRNAGGDADKKLAAMPKSSYIWFKFENTNLTVSSLKTKVWTHIVMTFDGTNGRVYENGVLKGTTGAVSSIYTDCDDFVIGARANAANATTTACQLVGNMSDVRVYVTALSTDDIKALYQNSAYIDNQGNIYGAIYEEV